MSIGSFVSRYYTSHICSVYCGRSVSKFQPPSFKTVEVDSGERNKMATPLYIYRLAVPARDFPGDFCPGGCLVPGDFLSRGFLVPGDFLSRGISYPGGFLVLRHYLSRGFLVPGEFLSRGIFFVQRDFLSWISSSHTEGFCTNATFPLRGAITCIALAL